MVCFVGLARFDGYSNLSRDSEIEMERSKGGELFLGEGSDGNYKFVSK